ncbi:hypothetical protein B7486_34290 [cyanobacterium TDX16]|nr:hypothetical protein B7486_34290 [cyanobacterium TDX16]
MRLMAVCHDSVGIGHLRRTLAIAERATQTIPSCRALVVSGTVHVSNFTLPDRVDYIKLPSLRKGPDYRYCAKTLGVNLTDTIAIRSALLTATAASYRPDVLLIDKSPVGVHDEAETALRLVRDRYPATRVIFGMRDIEDAPEQTIREWKRGRHLEALEYLVDEIWVYGDPEVFDVVSAYELPNAIAQKIRYVGFIARSGCSHDSGEASRGAGTKNVLVTVGGGTDGYRLLDQYLSIPQARQNAAGIHSTIIGGPDLPRDHANEIRRRAAAFSNLTFLDTSSCMNCEYRRADVVLCMGGYNTMVEVLRAGRSMLVYPRVEPRLEQYIRAKRFAAHHLCEMLDPNCVTPEKIQDAIDGILSNSNGRPVTIPNMNGLKNVAERLSELEVAIRDSVAVFV